MGLSDDELERRTLAVNAVIHSGRLEGLPDNPAWIQQMRRFAAGAITREELRAFAHSHRHPGRIDPESRKRPEEHPVSDDIVGYLTVKYPLRREYESPDYETTHHGWHYIEVAPNGAEVTIDLPNPDHILELAVTDDAGFLFDNSDHEIPISRAITALIPDFAEYETTANTADARRRAELWASLRAADTR